MKTDLATDVLVLGAGPGGYTAAFRLADLGKKVTLVERYPTLGGVCLNVGCIPSKALLHIAKVLSEVQEVQHCGVKFSAPNIDLEALRTWKSADVVAKLTQGLSVLAKQRGVQVLQGRGEFTDPHRVVVTHADNKTTQIQFEHAIIAVGSHAIPFPNAPQDARIMDSTEALALADIPNRLLVIGGGIIGMELGTVYAALGSQVSVVELGSSLLPDCDSDLVRPLHKRMGKEFKHIMLNSKVESITSQADGLLVRISGDNPCVETYDKILVAIGRKPNGKTIHATQAGVTVTEQGFIPVDEQFRTNVAHIFAIGDVIGQPMLAHKAVHEGKIAAEVIAAHQVSWTARVIPSVAYTDPEVAWVGVTESQARKEGIAIDKASFPWQASGRALSMARGEGLTKLIFDKTNHRLIGAGMVGVNAGELLAETVLAIEMGADAHDLGLTIHPHPTLSETIGLAAEIQTGSITDLFLKKR